ncbi:DUF1206 domain-containing protein [Streptomyces sp. H27-D2]|uniref:DUF1206 domain-containing protein n=1 Tax=Streptomyces sp. H27-D2 TaxID=3046304 RepID=UPI002DB5D9B9|nr:DUF1206 domain-containing protein [Streptomyces sp. H27-D2]MEC4021004.1 DUF1206 domain-containing protein [Streptomyces sp. H27-D2]
MTSRSVMGRGRRSAKQASDSSAMEAAARWGLAARGAVYVLVGLLALRIAFGDSGKQADRGGALEELAKQPFGAVLVWALGIGMVGMALWRLSEALFGAAGPKGHKVSKRLTSAVRCVFYGLVAYSVISFAVGEKSSGSSDKQSQDVTARALELPLGRWLVGLGGLVIVGAGLWIVVRAIQRKYRKHLKLSEMSKRTEQAVDVLGVAGGVCRGVVFTVAGGFAVSAAVKYDPDEAKGLDDTLRSFADTPAGRWLLVVMAVGLVMFGLFSFAMARWRKV